MLKSFERARIRHPVVVYEDINAVFWNEKPENDKNQKFPYF